MNFQYYRAPGLVPAGAVPMLGAATSLLGQPLAPRGFMPAQGQMRPIFAASPAVAAAAARGILGAYPVSQPGLAAAGQHFSLAARQAYQPQQQALLLAQPGMAEQDMVTVSATTAELGDQKDALMAGGMSAAQVQVTPSAMPVGLIPGMPQQMVPVQPSSMDLLQAQWADPRNAQFYSQQMAAAASGATTADMANYATVLDDFNSDLNLKIDPDGYAAEALVDPPGFCFCWAGARATYGFIHGKVCYEVYIVENQPTDFGDDHQETDPHIVRLGWSADSTSFQLGEELDSYGYGGTGKFSTNCKFSNYGERFGKGDVIMVLIDLDSPQPSLSYAKNGVWLGVAHQIHDWHPGSKDVALFPHILTKNCRLEMNFGQRVPWYPPPAGFVYPDQLMPMERVRGMVAPSSKAECEMIMMVGLPGSGKTTWCLNQCKDSPEKRYNVIGSDTLIDKMKVMGLPRKRNYHGRWDVLISKSTSCLNKLFQIASKRKRNYILDQTNVYSSARKRKMKNFAGFQRVCAVMQPDDPELQQRSWKRTHEDGKYVPEVAVSEMKSNYTLPQDSDPYIDKIIWVDLTRENAQRLVDQYNQEGREATAPPKRPLQDAAYGQPQAAWMGATTDQYALQYGGQQVWASQFGRQPPPPPPQDVTSAPEKKQKVDTGGSALDFIKQEYAEAYSAEAHQVVQPPPPGAGVTYAAAAAGMYGVAGLPGVAVMPTAYERLLGESQRAAVAQSMYGAALYQPALAAPVKGLYGYPGLDSSQLGQSYLQQQQQLHLQQLQQRKAAGMSLAWSTTASPSKQIAASQSPLSSVIQGYQAITDQWPEDYGDKADSVGKGTLLARAARLDTDTGAYAVGQQKMDYGSYGSSKSKDTEERLTSMSGAGSGSSYYRSYGNNYNDSRSTGTTGAQAWKQEKREPAKAESDIWQEWGDQNRPGGFNRSAISQSWSGLGYGAGGRVKQEADDASRRNEKPRKSRWEPQASNDTTPPSDRPGILGNYSGGQQGGGSQDRQSNGRSWGRGSSDQSSSRSGGFGGQSVSSEWRAQPRDTDSRSDRRGGSDRSFSSRGNFNDRSQSERGRNNSRSFPDRGQGKEEGSFQDRSRQFGTSRRDDNRTFQDREKSGRGFGSGCDESRAFGSDSGSRQYPPSRDTSRNSDQGSRYRDSQIQPTPPGHNDRFANRADRMATVGSNEYNQFQGRGDRPGAPSGGNKMDFRGRDAPPGDNKMDFRDRGAPSGDNRMDFQGQRDRPDGLPDVKADFQGRGPPSGNDFQGCGNQSGAPPGGQSGGQEMSDSRARPKVTAGQSDSSLPGSCVASQDKSGSNQGPGVAEDKKPEVKTEDKQSLLGSKPSHDAPPAKPPHPMDGPPPGFGRGFNPRGGRGGMRPPFGMPPGPPPPRPGMFRGPPPGRGGPRFGGPRPGFGGPRGPAGGVHPLMGGPRGGFRPPGPGGPGGRGGRGGFGGPPRWQRPPRPPHM